MTKVEVFKFAAGVVVGIGTGKIVSGIIRSNVVPKTTFAKVTIVAASFIIAGMAANATKKYLDEMVDEAVESFAEAKRGLRDLGQTLSGEF